MDIIKEIGAAAVFEQLAEECTELAHAALKMARIIRGENPTPATRNEARKALNEEAGDVLNCIEILARDYWFGLDLHHRRMKMERWEQRIEEAKSEVQHHDE